MDKKASTVIGWTQLISRASTSHVDMKPVKTPWWKQYYSKMVLVMTSDTKTLKSNWELKRINSRSSALWLGQQLEEKGATFDRTRVEGGTLTLFFKDAEQAWKTWDVIDQIRAESKPFLVHELHCPVNDTHVSLLEGDFPTQVRSSLFQSQYRYRIVAHVPFGLTSDPDRMDSLMDDWSSWQDNGDGEISKNAMYRWHTRDAYRDGNNKKNTYCYCGVMSFYTNNQELSFVMKLSYPEFYHRTEKAVLLDEVDQDLFSQSIGENHDKNVEEGIST